MSWGTSGLDSLAAPGHKKGKLPNQPEQAMAITIHQSSKEIDNGVHVNPIDNMPLYTEIKGKDIEEQKEDISASTPIKIDQEREPLPLPSLYKAANPYRPPIPPTCYPRKDNRVTSLIFSQTVVTGELII